MFKVRKLKLAILVALSSCYPVYAQDPGAVLKNIQQNQVDRKEEPAAVEEETPSLDNAVVIKNLKSIEVNSQLLNSELSDYWEDEIGQSQLTRLVSLNLGLGSASVVTATCLL